MSTKVKWNGKWIDLNLNDGSVKIANIAIQSDMLEESSTFGYEVFIPILGMTNESFAICLLDSLDGEIANMQCSDNILKFYSNERFSASGIVLFSANGALIENKIIPICQISEEEIERVIPKIMEKLYIKPASVELDGQLHELIEFSNVRQVTEAIFSRQECSEKEKEELGVEQKILITYALQGEKIEDSAKVDTIYLNSNDFPIKGLTNGVEWTINWEGFDI